MKAIEIFGKEVGEGKPCFIVAEAGSNHNGSLSLGKKLIKAAKEVGADAVKFQAFKTEELVTKYAPTAKYMKRKKNLFNLLKSLELNKREHRKLYSYAKKIKIPIFWSVFDKKSADFIESLGAKIFKTGSGELTDLPLIKHIAEKGKPFIISTGMGTLEEVKGAVRTAKSAGNKKIIVMHCTTGYPCPTFEVNLNAMKTMREKLRVPIAYSDQTKGIEVGVIAASLGACMLEKHFTIDKSLPGVDHSMSMDMEEFRELIEKVREIENMYVKKKDLYKVLKEIKIEHSGVKITKQNIKKILGSAVKKPTKSEIPQKVWARKSIVACKKIRKGNKIIGDLLAEKRPGNGLSPRYFWNLIGKTATRDIQKDEQIKWSMVK